MVYRLCAEKDTEDTTEPQKDTSEPQGDTLEPLEDTSEQQEDTSEQLEDTSELQEDTAEPQGDTADPTAEAQPKLQPEAQSLPTSNGPLSSPDPETESQPSRESSDLCQNTFSEAKPENEPGVALALDSELIATTFEAEPQSELAVVSTESEDFIAQYDQIIQELDSGTEGLTEQSIPISEPSLLTQQEERREECKEEEDDDFDSLMAATPAVEAGSSPFGVGEDTAFSSRHPVRTQSTPFTDPIQEISRPESDKTLLDGPPRVLQPFLGNRAKVTRAPPNLPLPVKNTMLAAALFPEFLKELAALAQEHSILCYKILGDFEDSCC